MEFEHRHSKKKKKETLFVHLLVPSSLSFLQNSYSRQTLQQRARKKGEIFPLGTSRSQQQMERSLLLINITLISGNYTNLKTSVTTTEKFAAPETSSLEGTFGPRENGANFWPIFRWSKISGRTTCIMHDGSC